MTADGDWLALARSYLDHAQARGVAELLWTYLDAIVDQERERCADLPGCHGLVDVTAKPCLYCYLRDELDRFDREDGYGRLKRLTAATLEAE